MTLISFGAVLIYRYVPLSPYNAIQSSGKILSPNCRVFLTEISKHRQCKYSTDIKVLKIIRFDEIALSIKSRNVNMLKDHTIEFSIRFSYDDHQKINFTNKSPFGYNMKQFYGMFRKILFQPLNLEKNVRILLQFGPCKYAKT